MEKTFFKKFLKESVAISFGRIITTGFHFISIMIMTRYISKGDFGIYILTMLIAYVFNLFSSLGLEISIVKFLSSATDDEKKDYIFPTLLMRIVSLCILSIVFYAISPLIVPLFDTRIQTFIVFIPIIFFLSSLRDFFYNILQGLKFFKRYAVIQSAFASLRVLLLIVFLSLNILDIRRLIYIEIIIMFLTIIFQTLPLPSKYFLRFNRERGKYIEIIKFSVPLYFNSLLTFLRERMNVFFIGAMVNITGVALYEVAAKLPQGFLHIFQSFIIVYFPNLSTLFAQGKKQESQNLMNTSLIIISIGIPFIVFACFLFKNEIITILFSEKYLASAFAFSLLILNFYFRSTSNILGYSIVSAGYASIPVRINAVASIVNIISNLIMIPAIGFIGAVYSLVLMNIASLCLHYFFLFKISLRPNVSVFLKSSTILFLSIASFFVLNKNGLLIKIAFLIGFLFMMSLVISEFRSYSSRIAKTIYDIRLEKNILIKN